VHPIHTNKHALLKQYFGYDTFRGGQEALLDAIVAGRDALGVMPTGAGKSLCYQLSALLLPGVTLVISPLISLMRDQVQALVQNGVAAAYINSSLTENQLDRVLTHAQSGKYKIIYIAPERLLSATGDFLATALDISLLAVDEAHCISQWGQDFRPAYLDVPQFVARLPRRPVLTGFTATATAQVSRDIVQTLALDNPLTKITGFDRPNLYFEVRQPADKYAALQQYLRGNRDTGIVYCSTRKEVESVTARLVHDGYPAAPYHAGLPDAARSRAQDDFMHDQAQIIVATNAFGMGIDKSNVRFVVHYNMPANVESYYQEAGRAGRDGLPADCLLFYARKDINTALFLINQSENEDEKHRNRQLLNQMERYCETEECLRGYLLQYFGEPAPENCGNCSNYNDTDEHTDVTTDAKKVLSHITRLNNMGRQFLFTPTADMLLGKTDYLTDLPTYGIMRGSTRAYIRNLVSRLALLGYLNDNGRLSVTPTAKEVLFGNTPVTLKNSKLAAAQRATKKSGKKKSAAQIIAAHDTTTTPKKSKPLRHNISEPLFEALRALRLEIAREEEAPAFVIFSDATLIDMCQKHPRTSEEMLQVSGVGQVKLAKYGERFLQVLCQH